MKTLNRRRLHHYLTRVSRSDTAKSAFEKALPAVRNSKDQNLIAEFWTATLWLGVQRHFDCDVASFLSTHHVHVSASTPFHQKTLHISHIIDYWSPTFWHDLRGYGLRLPISPAKNLVEQLHKAARRCSDLLVFAYNIRVRFLGATYFVGGLEKRAQGAKWKAQIQAGSYELKRQPIVDFLIAVDQNLCPQPDRAEAEEWEATRDEDDLSQLEDSSTLRDTDTEDETLSGGGGLGDPAGTQAQGSLPGGADFDDPAGTQAEEASLHQEARPSQRPRVATPELPRTRQPSLQWLPSSPPPTPEPEGDLTQVTDDYTLDIYAPLSTLSPPTTSPALNLMAPQFQNVNGNSIMAVNGTSNGISKPSNGPPKNVPQLIEALRSSPWAPALRVFQDALKAHDEVIAKQNLAQAEHHKCQHLCNGARSQARDALELSIPAPTAEGLRAIIAADTKRQGHVESLFKQQQQVLQVYQGSNTDAGGRHVGAFLPKQDSSKLMSNILNNLRGEISELKERVKVASQHLAIIEEAEKLLHAARDVLAQADRETKICESNLQAFLSVTGLVDDPETRRQFTEAKL
ncbi:hypothetical protein BDU57DRAFT_525103 [Ampelomyces quisqualis]|uniref:Uncharacterized protein n=1 Tax=Ampelomyces quisqualis TaxID=50730 RepID=A0A6A5Q649_AMPQU|nr:hypothetical protein BDU57DRAFT_525103 [Ampelomyces quisqualis]